MLCLGICVVLSLCYVTVCRKGTMRFPEPSGVPQVFANLSCSVKPRYHTHQT